MSQWPDIQNNTSTNIFQENIFPSPVTFTYIFHVRVLVRDVSDEKLLPKLDNSSSDSKWWYWCCSECCSCTALLWCSKADYNRSNMAILHFICPIVYIFQWMTARLSLHCLSLFKMLNVLYWSVLKLCWEYMIVPTHHIQSVIDLCLCHGHQPIHILFLLPGMKICHLSWQINLSYSYTLICIYFFGETPRMWIFSLWFLSGTG